jgi:hypothetical protein
MAVMNFLEAMKYSQNPMQKAIIEIYARNSAILQYLPFKDISGNAYTYNLEETLPGVGFRNVNEEYTPSVGVINPKSESLKIGGGTIKIDRALINTQANGTSIIAEQTSQKTKAFALRFSKAVIKGNTATSPAEFEGLERRISGNQLLDAGSSAGGDTLTLDMVDLLIDAVEPEPDALLMNKTMRRKINKLVRASGSAIETVDGNFGTRLQAYAGFPILPVDYDNEANQILAFDEECPGGGSDVGTSIYAVRFGTDALCGLQNGTLDVEDQGYTTIYRTILVEWYCTISIFHPRCCARLRGIKNA